jgi:hypothetical protein
LQFRKKSRYWNILDHFLFCFPINIFWSSNFAIWDGWSSNLYWKTTQKMVKDVPVSRFFSKLQYLDRELILFVNFFGTRVKIRRKRFSRPATEMTFENYYFFDDLKNKHFNIRWHFAMGRWTIAQFPNSPPPPPFNQPHPSPAKKCNLSDRFNFLSKMSPHAFFHSTRFYRSEFKISHRKKTKVYEFREFPVH